MSVPLTAKYRPAKIGLFLAGTVSMGVLAGLYTEWKAVGTFHFFVGVTGTVLFTVASIIGAQRLMDRRTIVIIDESGLYDRRAVDRAVPWSAILLVTVFYGPRGPNALRIELSQPIEDFTTSWLKRAAFYANKFLSRSHAIYVSAAGTTASLDDVRTSVTSYMAEHHSDVRVFGPL